MMPHVSRPFISSVVLEFAWSPVYIRKDQLQLFLSEDHRQHDILSHKKTVHETKILENKADLIPPDIRKLVSIPALTYPFP